MNQKFSGEVGLVAGRDVKSSSAQASVNLHFHSGESKAVVTKFISDKQRNVIARKAFEIQDRTGTDKLMVYRRLMTVFDFKKMDEMPRDVHERALKYLDGWIRNGTMGQVPAASTRSDIKPLSGIEPSKPSELSIPEVPETQPLPANAMTSEALTTASHAGDDRQRQRFRAFTAISVGALVCAAILYYQVDKRYTPTQSAVSESAPLQCEYGGSRYTVGSIVMQAGMRARCAEAVGRGVEWQPLATNKRH